MLGCPKCNEGFENSTEVSAHINTAHRGTSYCPAKFKVIDIKDKAKLNKSDSHIEYDADTDT